METKDKGGVWLLSVVFTSFSTFEWVKTSLALCSHLSNLFLTSLSSLPPSYFPQNNWRWDQTGDGGKSHLREEWTGLSDSVWAKENDTIVTVCFIMTCLMVTYRLITFVFMVALTQLMFLCLISSYASRLCWVGVGAPLLSSQDIVFNYWFIFLTLLFNPWVISVSSASVKCLHMIGVQQMLLKTN